MGKIVATLIFVVAVFAVDAYTFDGQYFELSVQQGRFFASVAFSCSSTSSSRSLPPNLSRSPMRLAALPEGATSIANNGESRPDANARGCRAG